MWRPMINIDRILIPEEQLRQHFGKLRPKLEFLTKSGGIDMGNSTYGPAYANYLLLTHFPEFLPVDVQPGPQILYNRYYWFARFTRLFCSQHGKDVGLEQQAFQILEEATADIDWHVIEAIEQESRKDIP